MANRIKGITIEIGGDTTELDKALHKVNSTIIETQKQLKDVNKLLKLDPGNAELLAQKQKLLTEQINNTKEKLKQLNSIAEEAKKALDLGEISQSQYDAINREIADTEINLRNLEKSAGGAEESLKDLGDEGEKSSKGLEAAKVAAGNLASELVTKVASAVGEAVQYLGQLAKTGLESYETLRAGKRTFVQLGETADEASTHVQELADATLGLSVASADQVAYGQRMKASFNQITQEGTDYADIVNAITHGVVALNGSTEGLETAQTQLSQVFATGKMTQQDYNSIMGACPALLSELAKSMLGADASALELKEAIGDGSVSLNELADGLKNADVSAWADAAGSASGNIGDLFTQMKQSVSNAFRDILDYGEEGNTVYDQLKTIIEALKESISDVVSVVKTFLSEHQEEISAFMTFVAEHIDLIIGVVAGLAVILTTLATVIAIVTAAQMALNVVGAPVIGIIAAVVAGIALLITAGVLLYKNWDKIKERAVALKEEIIGCFTKVKEKITDIINKAKNWGKDLVQGLIDGIKGMINKVGDAAKGVADKIKSFLHFSRPDEGPLRDYEKWMPDFIEGMAKGIKDNKYKLTDALQGMTAEMTVSPNGGVTGSLNNIQSLLSQGNVIVLDTGELVGATAKSYNAEFGKIARLEAVR